MNCQAETYEYDKFHKIIITEYKAKTISPLNAVYKQKDLDYIYDKFDSGKEAIKALNKFRNRSEFIRTINWEIYILMKRIDGIVWC